HFLAALLLAMNILSPAGITPAFVQQMTPVEQYGYAVLIFTVLDGLRHYCRCGCSALARLKALFGRGADDR
ncbi:MAG: hypothetical protein AAF862_08605, partial [Pseudomonadota bacterium]